MAGTPPADLLAVDRSQIQSLRRENPVPEETAERIKSIKKRNDDEVARTLVHGHGYGSLDKEVAAQHQALAWGGRVQKVEYILSPDESPLRSWLL